MFRIVQRAVGASRPLAPRLQASQRPYVNLRTLKVLQSSPWIDSLTKNLKFQRLAGCLGNASEMQDSLLRSLHQDAGAVTLVGEPVVRSAPRDLWEARLGGGPRQIDPPKPEYQTRERPTADELVKLCRQHGPLRLVMHGALSKAQGGAEYSTFHAFLLVGTFRYRGRDIGILVDGNDKQSNPLMELVNTYAKAKYGGVDQVSRLTADDFHQIQARVDEAARAQGEDQGNQLAQTFFRFVDLHQMVEVANQAFEASKKNPPLDSVGLTLQAFEKFESKGGVPPVKDWSPEPNSVRFPNVIVKRDFLPPDAIEEISALCAEPGVIETFRLPE